MIKVPTPFAVGDVNLYLVGDTLIDTGPRTPEALKVLDGLNLDSIVNVVITHGHVDHHGLAYYLKEKTDCTVFVHKNDLLTVTDYENELDKKSQTYADFLKKSGLSEKLVLHFKEYYHELRTYGERCPAEPLKEKVMTEQGAMQVIHTPGHTGGSCCFVMGDVLYAGDTLLPTISTNPSIHAVFDETCGLKAYQQSLRTLSQIRVDTVFPGHGAVIKDHIARIHTILKEHEQRRLTVLDSLQETPQSLAEVTKVVFGNIPASEVLLALAECYDYLKILERERIVCIYEEKGTILARVL
ncbi:MAG: MBL fold metallo-hydrolase [Theionarchaea archaeon]|nr:MBL fold metallo-hydrolase [Theionarchaea archaeon]MBU7001938.1 MBL fold metallo-hydrolase [Theionarchaea archaeon]MBU7021728.1 MBL fold metallo-hydrolase [Theionarchaea archaeon]MBU7035751.1 MBL fold metallo-hydrolase [Theionarchaea archaeon]MBU7041461.1 MBL fold metallo-hydrolase [Theionarchaea archaeon]